MKLLASVITKEQWKAVERESHADLFGDEYGELFKEYNFVVLVTLGPDMVCYATIKELDGDTAFLNFGGTFRRYRGQNLTSQCLEKILACLKPQYKYIGFCCRTKNIAMIKVGLNNGFQMIGMKLILGLPNIEFLFEREN